MFTGYSYTLKCGNCSEKEVLKLARVPELEPELCQLCLNCSSLNFNQEVVSWWSFTLTPVFLQRWQAIASKCWIFDANCRLSSFLSALRQIHHLSIPFPTEDPTDRNAGFHCQGNWNDGLPMRRTDRTSFGMGDVVTCIYLLSLCAIFPMILIKL